MQKYTEISENTPVEDSREQILDNDKTIASHYSGTAFPTENLVIGMECYRTDKDIKYRLKSLNPVRWVNTDELNGKPTTPTPDEGNGKYIANIEYVKNKIAELVGSSPDALDTLYELAYALGNDPNFATTITNALAGKAPLSHTHTKEQVGLTNVDNTKDAEKTVHSATIASYLDHNNILSYGWNGLNYFNGDLPAGNTANKNMAPVSGWTHILRMNHGNSAGYYTDIATPFNTLDGFYWRQIRGGTAYGWYRICDSNNSTAFTTGAALGIKQNGDASKSTMYFHWDGQGGQPKYVWGGNDGGEHMYVYKPADFRVANANTVGDLGVHTGRNNNANKVVRTDSNGYIPVTYINSDMPVSNGNVTNVIYDNGDGYFRKCGLAHLISKITAGGGGGIVASSLEQNGYVKFSNGLILQWGWGSSDSSGKDTISDITFPVSFTICFGVSVSTQQSGYQDAIFTNADLWYQVISWTTTTVKVIRQQTKSPLTEPTKPFFWSVGK